MSGSSDYWCFTYGICSPPPPSPPPPPLSSSSTISSGAVAGITIGSVVIVVIMVLGLCLCIFKRRKETTHYGPQNQSQSAFALPLAPAPPAAPTDGYYNGLNQYEQQSPQPSAEKYDTTPAKSFSPPSSSLASFSSEQLRHSAPQTSSSVSGTSSLATVGDPGYQERLSPAFSNDNKKPLGFVMNIFTYEELAGATGGFSDSNFVGQGGFAYVYKGILKNGKEVAVKCLKAGSSQGGKEFEAEVETVSRVHHRHLVALVGYCINDSDRLLVYEFVSNGTLQFHLHGKGLPTMDWAMRMKVSIGSAKGLAYLHEDCNPKIIHRDIKAANILVELDFEAKVADFGLAKFSTDQDTHVSTRVMGTFGYLAPEYAATGKLTEKSDVYSFGVMLLELITGRRPTQSNENLVDWATPRLLRAKEDSLSDSLVDPKLGKNYDSDEMARMVACAAACVRHSARRRPKMSQVVRALEGNMSLSDLNQGVAPGQSKLYSAPDYGSAQYREDMRRFRQMLAAGTVQETGGMTSSSEYGEGAYSYCSS